MITIANEDGTTFNLDIGTDMEIENVMALLEAESGIPVGDQLLFHFGKQLTNPHSTLESYGVVDTDLLLLRNKNDEPQAPVVAGRDVNADSETMRRQLLGNPTALNDLRSRFPEIADAAVNDPAKFRELLARLPAMQDSAKLQQQHDQEMLDLDPYDVETQKRLWEASRQEAVLENMEQAMETMPEAFGRVHMLYVNVEVNGSPVKAFVDSGAQSTVMSPACAERVGISRLIDTRFSGIARGVGTAKILGRVHSAQLKMGSDLFLQCSFTVMEGKDIDLLFGLDMLKRHQAIIDLAKDALVIQGREIRFLPEHEIPKGDEEEFEVDAEGNPVPVGTSASTSTSTQAFSSSSAGPSSTPTPSFPGQGHSLSTPASTSTSNPSAPTPNPRPTAPTPSSSFPEASINSLINLGIDRAEAIRLLEMTGGNADMAASLLFSGGMD